MDAPPLIVTLALNDDAETYFNALRKAYFPTERNFLDAHLTLFHHLPDEPRLASDLVNLCLKQATIPLQVVAVVSIGRGVAYKLESAVLQQRHEQLQQQWQAWLTPQDQQRLWPHITVQNKVAPQMARKLLEELKISFTPFDVYGVGLRLWQYLGGPWKLVQPFPFEGD